MGAGDLLYMTHPLALPRDYKFRLLKAGLLTIERAPRPDPGNRRQQARKARYRGLPTAAQKAAMVPPLCQAGGCMEPCKLYGQVALGRRHGRPGYGIHCEKHAKEAADAQRRAVDRRREREFLKDRARA